MFGRKIRIGVGICAHNEEDFITYSIRSVYDFADVIAVSINVGTPWGGKFETLDRTLDLVKAFPDPMGKIRIQEGEWKGSNDQRNANLDLIRDEIDYIMTQDADEVYTPEDLQRLKRYIAWRPHVGQFRISMRTYWKSNPFHVIDPPEPGYQYIISRVRPDTKFVGRTVVTENGTKFVAVRETNEKIKRTIPPKVVTCHHFAYARSSERTFVKLGNNMHRHEVVPDWYENVWLRWDTDHNLENLHPTNPPVFKRAIPADMNSLPEVMRAHPFAKSK